MNVQTLITHMLIGMGEGNHRGAPLKTMKDLYLCFERDIMAIASQTYTNTGIVFAELIDAVEESRSVIREAMEKAQAKLAADDAAREAERLRTIQERIEVEVARPATTRRTAKAPVGRKKPGVSRKPVAVMDAPKRRGRPPKNR